MSSLSEQRKDDLEYTKRLNDKINKLEINIAETETKLRDEFINFEPNESDESDDVSEDSESTLKQPLDFLFIGDSICKHLSVDLVNPGGQNKLICRPGAKIPEIREALSSIHTQYKVDKLAVHVATNHIPQETPRDVARELIEFIDEIKSNMPETHLFISLILPKFNHHWLKGINCINREIVDASLRMDFDIIQHPYFSSRGHINDSLLANDGVHLSRLGVKQFGMDIKRGLQNH